jgi:hypothetical protein
MAFSMILFLLSTLLLASSVRTVDAAAPVSSRSIRGIHNKRRLYLDPTSKNSKKVKSFKSAEEFSLSRAGPGGFFTGFVNPPHGEEGHIHGYKENKKSSSKTTDAAARGSVASPFVSSAVGISSQELGIVDKCEAAQIGAEFRTSSVVPVYYEYEVLTNAKRDVLQVVDIVDKAVQHFLAVWLVDCGIFDIAIDTTLTTAAPSDGSTRRLWQTTSVNPKLRSLQAELAPIVGTGVGEWDIVLLGGTAQEQCTTEDLVALDGASEAIVCYKVIGSTYIYLDEAASVQPEGIEALVLETLTVGMNMVEPDTFTELDPDIYRLYLVSGYEVKPEALIDSNRAANQRAWDDGVLGSLTIELSEPVDPSSEERSGGAKFGIAFAILCLLCLVVFMFVYLWKNRKGIFRRNGLPKQRKHHNLDDETEAVTIPSNGFDAPKSRNVPHQGSHQEMNITFRSFAPSAGGGRGGSPESAGTQPLSPAPETPRHEAAHDDDILPTGSNIVSPRSYNWGGGSTISDDTDFDYDAPVNTPKISREDTDRLRVQLEYKKKLREAALRHQKHHKPSELVSPARSFDVRDTVDL